MGARIPINSELVQALYASPTFGPAIAFAFALFCMALLALFAIVALLRRRRVRVDLKALPRDTGGVALALDLVLVLVPTITITLVMLQSLWLMRETVILHYAAYNAARSARVYICPDMAQTIGAYGLQATGKLGCTGDRSKAEEAARLALVSAGPPWEIPCQSNCRIPEKALRAISGQTGTGKIYAALEVQARYAFDPPNVKLTVEPDPRWRFAMPKGETPPMRARLTFRHYVLYGLGPAFGTKRPDGYYYRETTAEVTLL